MIMGKFAPIMEVQSGGMTPTDRVKAWYLYTTVAQLTVRMYEVNQVIGSVKIIFLNRPVFFLHMFAIYSEPPSNINTMG